MRFLTKFYVLAALAACSILSSSWWLNTYWKRQAAAAAIAAGSADNDKEAFSYRLVVFGDSWSDDGYAHNALQGQVWPQKLCAQVSTVLLFFFLIYKGPKLTH